MGDLSKHFSKKEFVCKCKCGYGSRDGDVSALLVARLEEIREHFDSPITVTSGCRCEAHNRRVGGATGSQHLFGTAADIQVRDVRPAEVYEYCERTWSDGGLGRYNSFTHIDVRDGRARW